jgi:hypothetical protein
MLKTFCDLEGILSAYIRFQKPDGKRGEFKAGVSDTGNGVIFYECLEGDIDVSGWWVFWAYVVFEDGRAAAGEAAKVYVWREGCG